VSVILLACGNPGGTKNEIERAMAHLGASENNTMVRSMRTYFLRNSGMSDPSEDEELKTLNDAIQGERDPERLCALAERMIEILDAKQKNVPVRGK